MMNDTLVRKQLSTVFEYEPALWVETLIFALQSQNNRRSNDERNQICKLQDILIVQDPWYFRVTCLRRGFNKGER